MSSVENQACRAVENILNTAKGIVNGSKNFFSKNAKIISETFELLTKMYVITLISLGIVKNTIKRL